MHLRCPEPPQDSRHELWKVCSRGRAPEFSPASSTEQALIALLCPAATCSGGRRRCFENSATDSGESWSRVRSSDATATRKRASNSVSSSSNRWPWLGAFQACHRTLTERWQACGDSSRSRFGRGSRCGRYRLVSNSRSPWVAGTLTPRVCAQTRVLGRIVVRIDGRKVDVNRVEVIAELFMQRPGNFGAKARQVSRFADIQTKVEQHGSIGFKLPNQFVGPTPNRRLRGNVLVVPIRAVIPDQRFRIT